MGRRTPAARPPGSGRRSSGWGESASRPCRRARQGSGCLRQTSARARPAVAVKPPSPRRPRSPEMPAEAARLQAEASPFRVRQSGGPREAEAAKERPCPGDLGTLRVAVNRRERSRQRRTKAAVEPPDRRHGQSQHDVEAWIMGPTKSSGALSRASPKPTIMVAAKVMGMAQGARFQRGSPRGRTPPWRGCGRARRAGARGPLPSRQAMARRIVAVRGSRSAAGS